MMRKRLSKFIVISLLLHLVFLTIVYLGTMKSRLGQDSVEIEFLTQEEIQKKIRQLEKGQIVEQDEQRLNDIVPEDSRNLGRHNQKVVKETKSRHHGKFNNQINQPSRRSISQKPIEERDPEAFDRSQKPKLANLTPDYNWQNLSRASEQRDPAATRDYLEDVQEGEQTLLSTREFVYYTYYQRIKNQLAQYWEPKIKEKVMKLIRQGRNIAATGDKITRVIITLNSKGILVKVQVLEESGVKDLDDAAVEAFRAAAPFPNPPKGIADADGTIKIRWDFVLEV